MEGVRVLVGKRDVESGAERRKRVVQHQEDRRSSRGAARLDLQGLLAAAFLDSRVAPILGVVVGAVVGLVLVVIWASRDS